MQFIPRFFHGFLDYVVGIFVAALPWIFGLPPGLASQIPVVMGLGAVAYSLLTKYELGVIKIIPFRVHLVLDFASGVFFIAAPWIFRLHEGTEPYLAIGLFEIGAAMFTQPDAKGPAPTLPQS